MKKSLLRKLPGIDRIIAHPDLRCLIERYGRMPVVYEIREIVERLRKEIKDGALLREAEIPPEHDIVRLTAVAVASLCEPSLKRVINATGIILHTNLGRAPLGDDLMRAVFSQVAGYSNLEYDLQIGNRGNRNRHVHSLLKCLTGAQEVAVVNNNAAAIILALNTLAPGKEVIVSRGELIEIGGEFRLPEIMASSGAIMKEVGTTNRTRISDYEKAIGPHTALIFKAHKSNYTMSGFTEEVPVEALADCAKKHGLFLAYDIGSGLLQKPPIKALEQEPDIQSELAAGADIVMFSCDKLLGGPQAGVIAGKAELVNRCARSPLMRALRVDKFTIAALSTVCRQYLSDTLPEKHIPVFSLLTQSGALLQERARKLCDALNPELAGIPITARIVDSSLQVGGGTLPDVSLHSKAVQLDPPGVSAKKREAFAEALFHSLLGATPPVVAVLREGRVAFDVSTVFEEELPPLIKAIIGCVKGKTSP